MTEIKNKDRILEAIDQLRRRKARPDIDRICNFVFRRFGVDCKDTLADLQRLVEAEIVIKVEYKGNTSYRNAAKWSKYAMYKNRELHKSTGSTEIHNILSRAFASLLVEDPDYLDIGVPRTELERFMLQDDPLTDLTEIELILTKETISGFLVKLKNGNFSLADHPVPPSTSPMSASPVDTDSITVQARGTQQSFSVNAAEKPPKVKTSSPHKEKKPKLEAASPPAITTTTVSTSSPVATTSTSTSTSTSTVTAPATASMSRTPTKAAPKTPPRAASVSPQASGSGKSAELGAINVGGYRVGVRRKTAKKVFDPSDNYTPTRKRGRPAGSSNSSKKEAQQAGGVCCLCNGSVNSNVSGATTSKDAATARRPSGEKLLQCRDCSNRDSKRIMGKVHQRKWSPSKMTKAIDAVRKKKMGWKKASKVFNVPKTTLMRLSNRKYNTPVEAAKRKRGRPPILAHPSCVVGKNTGKEKPHSNQWVCHGCKLCAFCFETSENEAMAVCVECGDAYHLTCHNPPVTEEQWRNKWLCSSCDDIDKGDVKPTDVQPVDMKLIEVKSLDIKPIDTNLVNIKPVDIKPIDTNIVDIKPVDIKPIDTNLVDIIKSDDVKPVDVMPADIKPVDVTPADINPTDVKQTDIKPIVPKDAAPLPPLSIKSQRLIEEDPFFRKYVPKEKTPDPTNWTVDEVCKYLQEHGCAAQAEAFRHHEIDGRSLLLLTRRDVLYELGLKVGPALKVNHFVQLLQKKDIRKVFPFNEMLY